MLKDTTNYKNYVKTVTARYGVGPDGMSTVDGYGNPIIGALNNGATCSICGMFVEWYGPTDNIEDQILVCHNCEAKVVYADM